MTSLLHVLGFKGKGVLDTNGGGFFIGNNDKVNKQAQPIEVIIRQTLHQKRTLLC